MSLYSFYNQYSIKAPCWMWLEQVLPNTKRAPDFSSKMKEEPKEPRQAIELDQGDLAKFVANPPLLQSMSLLQIKNGPRGLINKVRPVCLLLKGKAIVIVMHISISLSTRVQQLDVSAYSLTLTSKISSLCTTKMVPKWSYQSFLIFDTKNVPLL